MHDPTFDIPDDDPARFTFADGDMLEPILTPERPLMNIYEVDAGTRHGYTDCGDGEGYSDMPIEADTRCYIAAESRSRAWVEFIAFWRTQDIDIEFLDKKHIHQIAKGIECERGLCEWWERDAAQDAA